MGLGLMAKKGEDLRRIKMAPLSVEKLKGRNNVYIEKEKRYFKEEAWKRIGCFEEKRNLQGRILWQVVKNLCIVVV